MGKIRGTAKRQPPHAFALLMESLRFVPLDSSSETFHAWRLKTHPKLLVRATASNLAGDTDTVLMEVRGPGVDPFTLRCDTETARSRLAPILSRLQGGTTWDV